MSGSRSSSQSQKKLQMVHGMGKTPLLDTMQPHCIQSARLHCQAKCSMFASTATISRQHTCHLYRVYMHASCIMCTPT